MFENEKSLFRKKINEITHEENNVKIIEDLIRLYFLKNVNKNTSTKKLVELYNLLGLETFVEVMEVMNGQCIQFPEIQDMKDTIQIAIVYYYKFLKQKSWNEIKEILKDDAISPVKYGINCNKLNQFILELSERQEFVDGGKSE